MGSVFRASHLRVPRPFAIKLLNPEVAGNREVFERFQREAEIASSLGHDNIVQVFDFNHTPDGAPYMVLEFLDGEDLSGRLRRQGCLTLKQTISVFKQVASALEAAHARGIVHRDLKPQNIFLCRRQDRDDLVKILDFGISKILHAPSIATRTGTIMGTPNYMSPEQARGEQSEIDQRTDIFALGAILYECLAGRLAFEAPTVAGILYKVCHEEPEPLHKFATVPEPLERAVFRAMSKERDARYASIGGLRGDFFKACGMPDPGGGYADTEPQDGNVAPAKPRTTLSSVASEITPAPRRRRTVAMTVGGSALAVTLGLLVMSQFSRRAERDLGAHDSSSLAAPTKAAPAPSPTHQEPVVTPLPSEVEIRLRISPAGAKVELDGVLVEGRMLHLAKGSSHTLVVSADGYETEKRPFVADLDGVVAVELKKPVPAIHEAPKAKKPSSPKKKNLGPVEEL